MSKRNLVKVDYKELLIQLKQEMNAEKSDSGQAETVIPKITDENRQRMMSNPEVRYAVSSRRIHDKKCPFIKGVSSEFLSFRERYDHNLKQCPECALMAYIRAGAEDMKNYKKYVAFFNAAKMNSEEIKAFYFNYKCTTKIEGNILTVKNREDVWKIVRSDSDTKVRLMHNNYIINPDNTRTFNGGFHLQADGISVRKAIGILTSYKYSSDPKNHMKDEAVRISKIWRKNYKGLSAFKKLKYKIRKWLINRMGLNTQIRIDGFNTVREHGYPGDGVLCAYIWETEDGDRFWLMGTYTERFAIFSASFGGKRKSVSRERVIAWKPMSGTDFGIV